ncbi:MAG: 2-oxoacid:acceptor oxidoreductase family protein [Desulfobacteraceae bacterium]|jgi:2-oxoglutarate ferredoxin oxidoreductase subunit gamma
MITETIFAGFGGQGVLMMGYVFAVSVMKDGKHVTYLPSYGAEVRGGTANCTVVVSDEEIASPVSSSPDHVIVMNNPSLLRYQGMIRSGGVMMINASLVTAELARDDVEAVHVPVTDIANELGNPRTANMIMLGAFAAKTGVTSLDSLMNGLTEILKGKKGTIMELNRKGMERGASYASR